jgi:hypothetical protein
MIPARSPIALIAKRAVRRAALVAVGFTLFQCSSSSDTKDDVDAGTHGSLSVDAGADAAYCYPDHDGINGGEFPIDLVVNDTGFYSPGDAGAAKNIIATQNDAVVMLTLTNRGLKPHGFKVGCANVTSIYPDLPAGCSPDACFPSNAVIAPIMPGQTVTITFDTPTPDGLNYPFTSNDPDDADVPGLNMGQWALM